MLQDIIGGPALQTFHRLFFAQRARQENERDPGLFFLRQAQRGQAVEVGKRKVRKDEVKRPLGNGRFKLGSILSENQIASEPFFRQPRPDQFCIARAILQMQHPQLSLHRRVLEKQCSGRFREDVSAYRRITRTRPR